MPGKEPVEKRGACPTNVQVTGGRRSEADADLGGHSDGIMERWSDGIMKNSTTPSLHFSTTPQRFFRRGDEHVDLAEDSFSRRGWSRREGHVLVRPNRSQCPPHPRRATICATCVAGRRATSCAAVRPPARRGRKVFQAITF